MGKTPFVWIMLASYFMIGIIDLMDGNVRLALVSWMLLIVNALILG